MKKSIVSAAVAALLAGLALGGATNAMAFGKIVFDPVNYTNANLANFYQLVKQLTEAKRHTEQFVSMLKNEFQLQDSEVLRNAMELASAVKEMQGAVQSLQQGFGASQFKDWKGYIMNIAKRAETGNDSAKKLLDTAYEADAKMRTANDAYRAVMHRIPNVAGATEAAQATANAVAVVIQQNQAALGIMSAQARDAALARTEATAEKQHRQEAMRDYIKQSDEALDAMKSMR